MNISCQSLSVLNSNVIATSGISGSFSVKKIVTDNQGGYLAVGEFLNRINNSIDSKGNRDIFLVRFNSSFNLQWIKTIGGTADDYYSNIVLTSNGDIIILGGFKSDCYFTGAYFLANPSSILNTFLAKYDLNGNFISAKRLSNSTANYTNIPTAMELDTDGKLLIAGSFLNTINFFDKYLVFSEPTSARNIFLIKTDFDGNIDWVQVEKHTDLQNLINSISSNTSGILISGICRTSLSFSPYLTTQTITNSGTESDGFIALLDKSGNLNWIRKTYNGGADSYNNAVFDDNGDIYVTGEIRKNTTASQFYIDSTSTTISSTYSINGDRDIFIAKYLTNGNLQWKKKYSGTNISGDLEYGFSLFVDKNVTLGSSFFGTGKIIIGKDTLTGNGGSDFLAIKISPNGNEIGANIIGGNGNEPTTSSSSLLKTTAGKFVFGFPYTSTPLNIGGNVYSKASSSTFYFLFGEICPIIGIFENPTTTNLYVDPSKPQTGTIELDVKGDVLGGYSYQWSKKGVVVFSRSSSLSDLGPDTTYTVKVDYLGSKCSKARSFTVLRSITEKSTASTNSTSCAAKDGTITAVVTNNTNGKYTVIEASIDSATWFKGTQSGNDYTFKFTGLTKGDYQLYYRLSVGGVYHTLVGSKIFIDEIGNPITWKSTTVTPIHCNGDKGTITVLASGGTLTYSVTTSSTPNYLAQNSYSNLTAGTYYINITDGACQYRAAAVNLTNPAPLTISSTNTSTCFSGSTGGISVKAEGGTAPYQYQLSDGTTTTSFQTSNVFSGLTGTSYTVTVKDIYGCTSTPTSNIDLTAATSSIGIRPPTIVSHYYSSIIPGKIIIVPEGGTNSTFTYKIDPTGYTQTQSNFENLLPYKYYNITILHNAGCSYSEQFEIKDLNQAYPLVYRKPN